MKFLLKTTLLIIQVPNRQYLNNLQGLIANLIKIDLSQKKIKKLT